VDRVYDVSARVHGTSLNVSHSFGDLRPGLNESKGYSTLLILAVGVGMDDPRWLGRHERHDRGGAPGPWWQLVGVGRYWLFSPLNTIRCSPTASGWRVELVLLTLDWRRAMVAASDGGAPCSSLRVNVRWLQVFSGLQNRWAVATTAPLTRGVLQLRWELVEDDVRWQWLGLGVLWVKIWAI
jgi:hypothetical protein